MITHRWLSHPPKLLYISEDWPLSIVFHLPTHPSVLLCELGQRVCKPHFCFAVWLQDKRLSIGGASGDGLAPSCLPGSWEPLALLLHPWSGRAFVAVPETRLQFSTSPRPSFLHGHLRHTAGEQSLSSELRDTKTGLRNPSWADCHSLGLPHFNLPDTSFGVMDASWNCFICDTSESSFYSFSSLFNNFLPIF